MIFQFIKNPQFRLNTQVQYRFLEEILTTWIPDSSQLWTASHALGIIDYARQSKSASLIDFSSLNFDIPQVIVPKPKECIQVYDIAIPKEILKKIWKGNRLVVVENQNDRHYNLALGEKGYLFLPASNNRQVYLTAKGDQDIIGLRDRDYLKDEEIVEIKKKIPNLKILHYYAFENYIYHPDNLEEIGWLGFDKAVYTLEIVKAKNEKIIEIVSEISVARQKYIELKELIKNDERIKAIISALKSDDLEVFYPFFSMKSHFDKGYLNKFTYATVDLVRTTWFQNNIEKVLQL